MAFLPQLSFNMCNSIAEISFDKEKWYGEEASSLIFCCCLGLNTFEMCFKRTAMLRCESYSQSNEIMELSYRIAEKLH